jgi:hypothetical protein
MVGREEETSTIVCFTFLGNATRAWVTRLIAARACRMMTREVLSGVGVPRVGMYETRSPVVVVHLECLD